MVNKYLAHLLPEEPDWTSDAAEDWEEYANALDAIIAVFPVLGQEGSPRRKSARLKAASRRQRGAVRPVISTEPGPPEGDPSKDRRPEP